MQWWWVPGTQEINDFKGSGSLGQMKLTIFKVVGPGTKEIDGVDYRKTQYSQTAHIKNMSYNYISERQSVKSTL